MVIEVKNSIKIFQKASTELIVDLQALKEQDIVINVNLLNKLLDLTDNIQNIAENLWKEYPGILRINPGKLLKTATLSNRKEWAKRYKSGYEDSSERWRPIHNVQSVVLSIISLLSDPNTDSPANIEGF